MAKKNKEPKVIWCVFIDDVFGCAFGSYEAAKKEAVKAQDDDEGSDVKIFEVVRVWSVDFPPEPRPEVYEIGLDTL